MKYYFLMIWTCIAMLYFLNCTYYKLPEPETPELCDTMQTGYTLNIKEIIDENCALPQCHVSGTAAPGDYSTYRSFQPYLNASEFEYYVIVLKEDPEYGMPPNWDTNPYNKDLTDKQFELVQCWVDQGYPE